MSQGRPAKVNGQQSARARADFVGHRERVEVHGEAVAIGEHRHQSRVHDRVRGRAESHRRRDDLVAGLEAEIEQRKVQRRRARAHRDRRGRADVFSKRFLKARHTRAAADPPLVETREHLVTLLGADERRAKDEVLVTPWLECSQWVARLYSIAMRTASSRSPRVSVVTAAYNAAAFIEDTLASALGQSLTDLELIVIDDGSKDDTAEVVRRIGAKDPRVRLLEQQNRGLAATRNRGLLESRGEMVAFLDHDDLWHREKLALQVALLDERPAAGVASCYSALIDQDHNCIGWRYGGNADGDVYREMLEWDMVSGGSVALIRRTAIEAVGCFDETLPMRSDWDMWIRLARRYPFVTVPRALVGYTRSPFSSSRGYERMAEAGSRVLEKAQRDDPAFDPSSTSILQRERSFRRRLRLHDRRRRGARVELPLAVAARHPRARHSLSAPLGAGRRARAADRLARPGLSRSARRAQPRGV